MRSVFRHKAWLPWARAVMLTLGVTQALPSALLFTTSDRQGEASVQLELMGGVSHVQGKRVAVSGAGNVSIYAVEKCLELGATVLTVSDSKGYIYESEGISKELLDHINDVKVAKRGSLSDVKVTSNGACCRQEYGALWMASSSRCGCSAAGNDACPLRVTLSSVRQHVTHPHGPLLSGSQQ